MKIISLQAENLKRLVAVEIRPDGNLVQITGRNGAGKTSVLDAIWWALAGTRNVQAKPIRKGQERALIKLDLGELRVTRTFTAQDDGSYTTGIKVESAEGARFNSPQAVIDALLGDLSFDPLAFTRMGSERQFDVLKQFVPGVNFSAIAAANRKDFEERTNLNRRAKDLRAQAEGIQLPPGPEPKRVDVAALEQQLGDAAAHNTDVAAKRAALDGCEKRVAEIQDEIRTLTEEMHKLQRTLADTMPPPAEIDIAKVREDLAAAREANRAADAAERRKELNAQAQAAENGAAALTKRMEERDDAKEKAVRAASMPVAGITFGDTGVLLNGVPFDQASDAQQLRASVAIAASLNPKLRVVRVRDGSLLDDDGMKWLAEYAEQHDLQVWIERVDSSGAVGFVMEAGRLKGDEPEEAV